MSGFDDITLFTRLAALADGDDGDVAGLVASLAELARMSLSRRVPLLAAIAPALSHRDGRVRSAALSALEGADGRMALAAFVAALDDDDAAVRAAGVRALRALLGRDPMRWAHVVFHARADVRRASLALREDETPSELCFFLLADEACRDLVAPLLGDDEVDPRLPVPSTAYPAVLALLERERLDVDQALRLVARIPIHDVIAQAQHAQTRDVVHIGVLIDDREPPEPAEVAAACAATDGYDGLFGLMARASDPRVPALRRKLSAAFVPAPYPLRRRVLASVRAAMLLHGEHAELALLMAAMDPHILLVRSIPIDVRRHAARGLIDVTHGLPRPEPEAAAEMMLLLATTPRGPDLRAAAGITCLGSDYAALLATFPVDELLAAIAADPESAAAILMVPDGSKRGRAWLLRQIAAHDRETLARVLAWLAIRAPTDKLSFLDELEPEHAQALALRLIEVELNVELKHNKRMQLVARIGWHIPGDGLQPFARQFLAYDELSARRFGRSLFEHLATKVGAEGFARALCDLSTTLLLALVRLVPELTRLSYGCEVALASVLVEHPHDEIRAWARERVPITTPPPPVTADAVAQLSDVEMTQIAECSPTELEALMRPLCAVPSRRLAEALSYRAAASPMAAVCAALLGCHDEPDLVAAQFARFSSQSRAFLDQLEPLAVRWEAVPGLPWLGSAWLWRWERHAEAVASQMVVAPARPLRFLRRTLDLPSELLRARAWQALGEAVNIWSVRDVARVHQLVAGSSALAATDLIIAQLDTDVDVGAAKLYVGFYRAGVAAAVDAVERVKAMLPDVSAAARVHLERVTRTRGLAATQRAHRRRSPPLRRDELAAIRASVDADALEQWCRDTSDAVVQEAALRCIDVGGDALHRLPALILLRPRLPHRRTLIESIALWPENEALATLREAAAGEEDDELRFRLCSAFHERGEDGFLDRAVSIVCTSDGADTWFRPADYQRLSEACGELACAVALAGSAQAHAYMLAIPCLLKSGSDDAAVLDALRRFLTAGTARLEELRIAAARHLHMRGDQLGFPLVLGHALNPDGSYGDLFRGVEPRFVDGVVDAILLAGPAAVSESRGLLLLEPVHVDPAARDRAHERLLVDAALERTAERIMNIFTSQRRHSARRDTLLSRIADVFAWGTREGLALTRRRHTVHMSGREHLGYTRFDQDKIWVTALPILRGDRNGDAIVEALILHEIGHHRHHRGPVAERSWKAAESEGLFGLLNLVADEHLERNLRALDASYGDRLKQLAAHAFRHAHRDLPVSLLVGMLGHESFDVLSACSLGLARGSDKVRVESGRLLNLMERRGLSFARFMRALRMGLGNRYQDDKVARALKLFPRKFRHYSMAELLVVTEQLRDIFGWETALCGTYGGHETVRDDAREQTRWGHGITDDDVQREVERVLNPAKRRKGSGAGDPNKLWINVSESDTFDLIHNVERVEPDPVRHREVSREVARHTRTLKRFLERLGLASARVSKRLRGTRLDRGRLTALVTRRDPRVLVNREVVRNTDLFLGVVVDCSGSMEGNANIERARRFAVLVAEAVRDMSGVDARFFGFTDSVIYDAGDARGCGAASLVAGGGNNDAAALLHAATAAKRSRRRAKVLVMISDGLPTECSTEALKALVGRVTRSGICVAQVAVCPLEEVCFPHYVVLEGELDASVRKFGQVVAKLVKRVL